jgi:hypothetical protein
MAWKEEERNACKSVTGKPEKRRAPGRYTYG